MTKKKERTAVYIGTADVRVIRREDFQHNQGFDPGEDMPVLVWHAGNRFALPVQDLPTEVQDHLTDVEPDIVVHEGVPENLIPFLRLKTQTTSQSGRVAGLQAAEGATPSPAHPEAVVAGQPPVISPDAPAVPLKEFNEETASGEGQAEGGGSTDPGDTRSGAGTTAATDAGTTTSKGR